VRLFARIKGSTAAMGGDGVDDALGLRGVVDEFPGVPGCSAGQLLVGGGWGWKGVYHHQWARSPVGPGQGGTAGGG